MKKLMIAAAVVLAGIAANAASISWNSGTVYLPDADGAKSEVKSSNKDGKEVSATLYTLTKEQYLAVFVEGDALATQDKVLAAMGDWTAKGSGTSTSKGLINGVTDETATYSLGDTAYAALVYTTDYNGDTQYLANVAAYEFKAADDYIYGSMATTFLGEAGTINIENNWTAVPEPTSGLLLLLGVAGLALRRRRA